MIMTESGSVMQASCADFMQASVFDSRALADAWPCGRQHDAVFLLQGSSERHPLTGGRLFVGSTQHRIHLGLGSSD